LNIPTPSRDIHTQGIDAKVNVPWLVSFGPANRNVSDRVSETCRAGNKLICKSGEISRD